MKQPLLLNLLTDESYLISLERVKSDLKNVLESCSPEERSEATAYLGVLERIEDSHFHQEMLRRSEDLQAGRHRLSSETVSEIDSGLSSRGL